MDKLTFCALIALIGVCVCDTTCKFQSCGSTSDAKAKVSGVGTPGGCVEGSFILKKGKDITVFINFTMESGTVNKLKAVVHGVIAGVPVPFSLSNDNGCVKSGLTCPLKSVSNDVYEATIPVKSMYPSIRLVVKWELVDESGKDLWCVEIPAQIQ